jgi:FHS family Na+ dependent glucose MFS transporter 1
LLQQEFIFSAGFLLDKYPNNRLFLLFGSNFVFGLTTMVLPHAKLLWVFFLMSGLASFSSGAIVPGGNVLCLEIWNDGDAGPYMHSIHFSFAIGAFLAPVLALPFLSGHSSEETLFNSTQWVKSKPKVQNIFLKFK